MGKSDKKVKSERINQLRKQYDAFLEEDKRRKERNEYILGRLDKMRYCTAVVPVRHKPPLFIDRRENFSTSSSLSQLNKSTIDTPRHIDEAAILQEISKKYYLVPKIRPSIETDVSIPNIKSAFEENVDWKSKYEILDQLKKREKESDPSTVDADVSQRNGYESIQVRESSNSAYHTRRPERGNIDHLPERDDNVYDAERCDVKVDQTELEYKYEIPENDADKEIYTETQNHLEMKTDPHYYPNNQVNDNDGINESHPIEENLIKSNLPSNEVEFYSNNEKNTQQYISNETESTPTFYTESALENQNIEYYTENCQAQENSEHVSPDMYSQQYSTVEDTDIAEAQEVFPADIQAIEEAFLNDIQAIEVISPDDLIKEINSTSAKDIKIAAPNVAINNTEINESNQYPIETINVQDLTPGDHVVLQDGVNINPTYDLDTVPATYDLNPSSEVAKSTENTANSMGIEEFEAEQREMFYSEGANENYDYSQANIPEGYEQGLPAESTVYPQETGNYFEGYETEQQYPIELGEQEATLRYDPHYEQQYANNSAVQPDVDQAGYAQEYTEHTQYGSTTNQIQESLEHLQIEQQHEYEPIENIEQQLDTEQGFTEKFNLSNIEKPIEDLQSKAPRPEKQAS